jgi:hypothetical protein
MPMRLKLYTALLSFLPFFCLQSQYNISTVSTPTVIENFTAFSGAGFQAVPTAGQLDSDGWEVTGWSNGNLAYGGTQTTAATDYTRGTTSLAVTTGGMYKNSNFSGFLMFQPGGADFAPGSITMRIQNTTGATLTSFDVSYQLLCNNDQGRSNNFNFSWSINGTSFVSVPSLNFTSTDVADALGFQSSTKSVTVSGVSIPNNGFIFLRWNSADVGGSGSRDEFGLDNITLTVYDVVVPPALNDGGMIVNEISNGPTGEQEYFEFVVVGSAANPLADVNLSGWLIDDNNGEFEGLGSGLGIASGHMRIASNCLTAVKPGSIILIYNPSDINPLIAAGLSDPTDSNNDCVYIFTPLDPCFEITNNRPNTSPATSSYFPFLTTADTWSVIGLANGDGDAPQSRKPDGTFFHGFSYGNVSDLTTDLFPNFPAILGGGKSFNVMDGPGTSRNYTFNCGDFTKAINFSRGEVTVLGTETPGAPNNDANRYFINAVRTGTYDYANLSNPNNCGALSSVPCLTILSVNLKSFNARKEGRNVRLDWNISSDNDEFTIFELQRSADAIDFSTLTTMEGYASDASFEYLDKEAMPKNYYRLKITDANGEQSYSQIRNVNFDRFGDLIVYPNPVVAGGILNLQIDADIMGIQLYNALGQAVYSRNSNTKQIELPSYLSAGIYTIVIDLEGSQYIRKLVIE